MVASVGGALQFSRIENVWDGDGRSGDAWPSGFRSVRVPPASEAGSQAYRYWPVVDGPPRLREARVFGFGLARAEWNFDSPGEGPNPRYWRLRIPWWFLTLLAL